MERLSCWLGIIVLWVLSAKMGPIAFSTYTAPAGRHIFARIDPVYRACLLSSCSTDIHIPNAPRFRPAPPYNQTSISKSLIYHLQPSLLPKQNRINPDTEQATLPPGEADTPCIPSACPSRLVLPL